MTKSRKIPKTVLEAAEADDSLAELVAIRAILARAIDNPNALARDLPPLTRRLLEVGRDIDSRQAQAKDEYEGLRVVPDEAWNRKMI